MVALSWPSEGTFGRKVAQSLSADDGLKYQWGRANRKQFRILDDVDRSIQDSPAEEVLLALGYRYLYGLGTREDCQQV